VVTTISQLTTAASRRPSTVIDETVAVSPAPVPEGGAELPPERREERPETPDYDLMPAPFGRGAFGDVWLARNAVGQWQALKVVHKHSLVENSRHYEIEFHGISRYKPISDKHPGLLRVDFVSRRKGEGFFYYVMELGDALDAGWQSDPTKYVSCNLEKLCRDEHRNRKRLPVRECVRIVTPLAEALAFLHGEGLTHRDIKPSNVIFVDGRPKLADVGLVTEIRLPEQVTTFAGTPGYMPPPPEPPGTAQADIYGLGMMLYVISTGRDPAFFPELSGSLMGSSGDTEFLWLNPVILRACQPDLSQRYSSAAEMHAALVEVQRTLEREESSHRW
jgi:serine/threonine protein kinase